MLSKIFLGIVAVIFISHYAASTIKAEEASPSNDSLIKANEKVKFNLYVQSPTSNELYSGDKLPFKYEFDIPEGGIVKAGTEINVKIPSDSVDWSTFEEVNTPNYIGVTPSSEKGQVTIKVKTDLDQKMKFSYIFSFKVSTPGNYETTVETLSSDINDINVDKPNFIVKERTNVPNYLKSYYTTESVYLNQATLLSTSGNLPTIGTFSDDGNIVSITSVVDFRNYGDANEITSGGPNQWSYTPEETGDRMNTLMLYYSLRVGNSNGIKIDYSNIKIYIPGGSQNINDQFYVVKNPDSPETDFFITPKDSKKTKGTYYALHVPVILDNPSSYMYFDVNMDYKRKMGRTEAFSTEYVISGNGSNFVPKISGPSSMNVEFNDQTFKLLDPSIVTANDIEDGDLTNSIYIEDDGGFNVNMAGSYEVIYAVKDSTGNIARKRITYNVKHNQNAKVNINYVNIDGEQIADSEVISGKYGESFDLTNKIKDLSNDNYEYLESSRDLTGTFEDNPITVDMIYKKKIGKSIKVIYVDTESHELASAEYIPGGIIGTDYDASSYEKSFQGYELISIPENVKGKFTEEEQVVKFVYEGILSLEGAFPENIEFGIHEIQNKKDEQHIGDIKNSSINIIDQRPGDNSWTLKASTSQFTSSNSILEGAFMSLKINNNEVSLLPNQESIIATSGNNSSETNIIIEEFQLFVPRTASKTNSEYSSNINWILSDGP